MVNSYEKPNLCYFGVRVHLKGAGRGAGVFGKPPLKFFLTVCVGFIIVDSNLQDIWITASCGYIALNTSVGGVALSFAL